MVSREGLPIYTTSKFMKSPHFSFLQLMNSVLFMWGSSVGVNLELCLNDPPMDQIIAYWSREDELGS